MTRLVASVVLFLFVAGCATSAPAAPPAVEFDLIDQEDSAVLRTGAVTFFSPGDGLLGVTLDESPADGRVDRVYLLQGADGAPESLPAPIADARLVDQRRAVLVGGGPGPVRVLALEELDPEATLEVREGNTTRPRRILAELAAGGGVTSWIGVGLSQRVLGPGTTWDGDQTVAPDPAPACQSGGPGAVSAALGCQGSGCRVTCRDGYYPCLDCTDGSVIDCSCVPSD